jgi:hypothetical protein
MFNVAQAGDMPPKTFPLCALLFTHTHFLLHPCVRYVPPYQQTSLDAASDFANDPNTVSSKFYYVEALLKEHDFYESIATDPQSVDPTHPLDCDLLPIGALLSRERSMHWMGVSC